MMHFTARLMGILLAGLSFSVSANPGDDNNMGQKLPADVRVLLIKEMSAIEEAKKDILGAIVRGEHERVEQLAQGIHDSFIMKQEMTAGQRQALKKAVTQSFIKKDKAFHKLAAELSQAAKERDSEKQVRKFSKMLDACVQCHSQHAQNRFPELKAQN